MIFKPFIVDYFIPHTFYILRMVFIEVLFRQEEKSGNRLFSGLPIGHWYLSIRIMKRPSVPRIVPLGLRAAEIC
jgi:hypothetical protein